MAAKKTSSTTSSPATPRPTIRPATPASQAPAAKAPAPVSTTPVRNTPIPRPQSSSGVPSFQKKQPSHDQIAKRAYEIWQSGKGGSQQDNWYRAERELRGF